MKAPPPPCFGIEPKKECGSKPEVGSSLDACYGMYYVIESYL